MPEELVTDHKDKKRKKRVQKKEKVAKKVVKKVSFPKAKGLVSSKVQQD